MQPLSRAALSECGRGKIWSRDVNPPKRIVETRGQCPKLCGIRPIGIAFQRLAVKPFQQTRRRTVIKAANKRAAFCAYGSLHGKVRIVSQVLQNLHFAGHELHGAKARLKYAQLKPFNRMPYAQHIAFFAIAHAASKIFIVTYEFYSRRRNVIMRQRFIHELLLM